MSNSKTKNTAVVERRRDQKEILNKLDDVIAENETQDIAIESIKAELKRLSDFIENHMTWEEAHQKLVLKVMGLLGVTAISLIGYMLVSILNLSTGYGIVDVKVKHHTDTINKVSDKQDEMMKLLYSIKRDKK